MAKEPNSPLGIDIQRGNVKNRSRTVVRAFWILFIAALVNGLIYLLATWSQGREKEKMEPISFAPATVATPAPIAENFEPEPEVAATPRLVGIEANPDPLPAAVARATPQPQPAATPAAPAEVVVKKKVELTVRKDGKVSGFINIKPGQRVRVLTRDGERLVIAWRDATGVIATADTEPASGR